MFWEWSILIRLGSIWFVVVCPYCYYLPKAVDEALLFLPSGVTCELLNYMPSNCWVFLADPLSLKKNEYISVLIICLPIPTSLSSDASRHLLSTSAASQSGGRRVPVLLHSHNSDWHPHRTHRWHSQSRRLHRLHQRLSHRHYVCCSGNLNARYSGPHVTPAGWLLHAPPKTHMKHIEVFVLEVEVQLLESYMQCWQQKYPLFPKIFVQTSPQKSFVHASTALHL